MAETMGEDEIREALRDFERQLRSHPRFGAKLRNLRCPSCRSPGVSLNFHTGECTCIDCDHAWTIDTTKDEG
jgi:uncharacterized Zn finger protein (UPF0148 family)